MKRILLILALITGGPASAIDIDTTRITVSGISSGGYMAGQLHVAYSDLFSGAAVLAAGPWGCADGSLGMAMARCMARAVDGIPLDDLTALMTQAEADGRIAPVANLRDDPVWIYRGSLDAIIGAEVTAAAAGLYRRLSDRVTVANPMSAAHHFPTVDEGSSCTESVSPFVGACDFDAAGALLRHLTGDIEAEPTEPTGRLKEIAVADAATAHLQTEAWLYLPESCSQTACGVHVVLHGCAQSREAVEDRFVQMTGYQRWADAAGLILLYPQVQSSPGNPYGCWDWWGYTGANYLDRDGAQMKAIVGLIESLNSLSLEGEG